MAQQATSQCHPGDTVPAVLVLCPWLPHHKSIRVQFPYCSHQVENIDILFVGKILHSSSSWIVSTVVIMHGLDGVQRLPV
jgi:hypothetical protein